MIPADALQKLRSVTIHYHYYENGMTGFSFFDKDGALLWKIGVTNYDSWMKKETVVLEENEVIVGVVAKLYPRHQSAYTDF